MGGREGGGLWLFLHDTCRVTHKEKQKSVQVFPPMYCDPRPTRSIEEKTSVQKAVIENKKKKTQAKDYLGHKMCLTPWNNY